MSALAKIHVLKAKAGLDDEDYRAMLERLTGKRSAKNMTPREHLTVIAHLEGGSAVTDFGGRRKLDGRFAKKLQALWIAGWNLGVVHNRDDKALLAFVKRQTGLEHTRFLADAGDAARAIEALKGWLAREAGVDWGKRGGANDDVNSVLLAQFTMLRQRDLNAPPTLAATYQLAPIEGLNAYAAAIFMDGPLKAHRQGLMNHMGGRIRKLAVTP